MHQNCYLVRVAGQIHRGVWIIFQVVIGQRDEIVSVLSRKEWGQHFWQRCKTTQTFPKECAQQYFLHKYICFCISQIRIRTMVLLYYLTLLFTNIWGSAAASDCDSFMYGTLCSTDHNVIWAFPDFEDEIECQVFNLIQQTPTLICLRLSALRHRAATFSCSWNSRQEGTPASFSDPARPTPCLLVPSNQIVRWLSPALLPRL